MKMLDTDFLIIGGGTAGCYAALTFAEQAAGRVLIVEKARIKRSGCLAAGVNAINAYIGQGKTPQDYVEYVRADAAGIVRGDLLLSMAEGLNRVTRKIESLGLTILKDENGDYVSRGWRNIKINGENIKPILAEAVKKQPQISLLERVQVFEYIVRDGRMTGIYAVSIEEPLLYVITAKAVLCATGGAAGVYKPNHPGFSRHKMWYSPFNTGAGYAMGILAGAEMTSLEMRFIALRCKDTIAPTGTLAQGVGAKQINALGAVYEQKYGITTAQRVYGTIRENSEGRGPCYLRTVGITAEQDTELQKAYLNMAPSQTLRWLESGLTPSVHNVEIEGTEPYIVGGHTASGYWVDLHRETTIRGLFAAGDVAGGCPQKYVTGAFVEGEIAAKAAVHYMSDPPPFMDQQQTAGKHRSLSALLNLNRISPGSDTTDALEEEMQSVMDQYAGGISVHYQSSAESLHIAAGKIQALERRSVALTARDMQEIGYILELRERLTLCRALIAHMNARCETRWPVFCERSDFPDQRPELAKYINSQLENGGIKIVMRELINE
ncbi:MAG: adenylyl-sulfate reductase subunit alpha [Peptococcaceae bacterium]|jgi:adenylylsulfate reductase subunit A|nr:adenylyl-sulfate reductase subunit alpha [Peptococcaceae bacterium]